MTGEVHQEKIAPGRAPGGVWVRICSQCELIREYSLESIQAAGRYAHADAEAIGPYVARGETIRTYFYDGDSGACIGTIVSGPPTP